MDAGLCSSSGAPVQHPAPAQSAHHQPCGCDYDTDVIMMAMGCKFSLSEAAAFSRSGWCADDPICTINDGHLQHYQRYFGDLLDSPPQFERTGHYFHLEQVRFPGRVSSTGGTGIFLPWLRVAAAAGGGACDDPAFPAGGPAWRLAAAVRGAWGRERSGGAAAGVRVRGGGCCGGGCALLLKGNGCVCACALPPCSLKLSPESTASLRCTPAAFPGPEASTRR